MIEERTHLLALAEQGFELAESLLPARGWSGMRAGGDQFVFGSGQARQNGRGAALPDLRGSAGGGPLHRPARAQLWTSTTGPGSGALPRRAGAQAGRAGRIQTIGRMAAKRTVAARATIGSGQELTLRHGKQSGTRQMIQVLSLIKQHGHERVRAAVEEAVTLGCWDAAAIRHLAAAPDLTPRAQRDHRVGQAFALRTSIAGDDGL